MKIAPRHRRQAAPRGQGYRQPGELLEDRLGAAASRRDAPGGRARRDPASRAWRCCSCRPNSRGGRPCRGSHCCCETLSPSRRAVLVRGGALFAWAYLPRFAQRRRRRDPRFVVIILRGALDGLSAVAPDRRSRLCRPARRDRPSLTGEHAGAAARRLLRPQPGDAGVRAAVQGKARQPIVHAAATAYRERSHFDGQDVLESGYPAPGHVAIRLAQPRAGGACREATASRAAAGSAVGPTTPLVMRGPAPVLGWAPQILPAPRRRSRRPRHGPLRASRSDPGGGARQGPRRPTSMPRARHGRLKPRGGLDTRPACAQAARAPPS